MRSLEIQTFVALNEIDPVYFNRSYWLAPANRDYAHAYGNRATKRRCQGVSTARGE